MGAEGNIKTIQTIYEAFGRGDVVAITDVLTDDVDWATEGSEKVAPWYGPHRGTAGVQDFFTAFGSTMEVQEFAPITFAGTENEFAVQEAVFTRRGCDRVMKYAFEFARKGKKKHVTSATKSNGIIHSMPFWDERFNEMKKNYPDIRADQYHIDILTAHFVRNPDWFDVVVGSNLFGDILSDLGPALTGSIGVAPSGNINPERKFPSMFEPVHGSAPDIAGKFIANPIGQIWSGAMMVRHLGYPEAAEAIERAIAASLVEGGPRTRDLGGNGDTKTVGSAIAELVKTV